MTDKWDKPRSNYDKIEDKECVECGGHLVNISSSSGWRKECEDCGCEYYHPDDMGPGCWRILGVPKKEDKT